MSFEFFFFWCILVVLAELWLGQPNSNYVFALIMSLIFLVILLLFWYEIDLFASIFFAVYSSVFVALSLVFVYMHNYLSKALQDSNTGGNTGVEITFIVFVAFMVMSQPYSSGYSFFQNTTVNVAPSWFFLMQHCDFYNYMLNATTMTASLMHTVLYKFYSVEVLFFNVYLFIALVLATLLLLLLKLILNPATAARILSTTRLKFWLFFPTNSRIRVANKIKRQVRRKNTAVIKYKS